MVLDASVALSWCFEDETTPQGLALLDHVVQGGAVVPALWPLEVLNGLMAAERRRRLDRKRRHRLEGFLRDLPVRLDTDGAHLAWNDIRDLAETHQLTPYDAAYLELAIRLELPLGTLDRALRSAAAACAVPLIAG